MTTTTTTSTSREARSLEVISPRLAAKIAGGQAAATSLLDALTRDEIVDEIGTVGPKANGERLEIGFDVDSTVVAGRIGSGGGWRRFHPHAVAQLSDRLGIPGAFVRREMNAGEPWRREVIADIVSSHLAQTPERDRFLVRSVGSEIRGVLSDAYRRLSSPMLATAFRDGVLAAGAIPYEAGRNDLKWWVRAILPTPVDVVSRAHGTEWVGIGVRIGNSDFGAGALDLDAELLRLVCVNGMVGESVLRAVHLGGRLPPEIRFADETYAMDTQVQALAIRDALPQLLSAEYVEKATAPLRAAMDDEVDAEKAVAGVVRATRIGKAQAADLSRLLMNRDGSIVPTGPVTRWSVAQAVSALANDATDVDDATELRKAAQRITLNTTALN